MLHQIIRFIVLRCFLLFGRLRTVWIRVSFQNWEGFTMKILVCWNAGSILRHWATFCVLLQEVSTFHFLKKPVIFDCVYRFHAIVYYHVFHNWIKTVPIYLNRLKVRDSIWFSHISNMLNVLSRFRWKCFRTWGFRQKLFRWWRLISLFCLNCLWNLYRIVLEAHLNSWGFDLALFIIKWGVHLHDHVQSFCAWSFTT